MSGALRVALAALLLVPAAGAQAPPPADLVIHNAVVHTVDAARPRASALAVRGSRLAIVGSDADALAVRGPATRVIDAGGRTVIPGLHDAHAHFLGLGAALQQVDLRGTSSLAAVLERVRERAVGARSGEWILGRSWDQNDWPDKRWPTAAELDTASPDHAVYLERVDGHAALVNSRALAAAGITASTPDPAGGRIIRDAAGRPTGVLVDEAMTAVERLIPPPSPAQLEEQLLLADAACRRLGLTTIHDAGVPGELVDVYKRLIDAGRLHTRLYVMLRMPLARLQPFLDRGPLVGYADHRLDVRAIKIGADGALGSRGAALLEPYADEPGTSGFLTLPEADIEAMTRAAARAGFQTAIHAIGDRANRVTMDVFERVGRDIPGARALRPRTEHAQILDAAEIPRFKALGVIASIQPTHCTSDMPWAPARLGAARVAAGAYLWQRLRKAGAVLAAGSDFPVEEANPMLGLYAAVTRQALDGRPAGGWGPSERLSPEEALRAFTLDAAYAAHNEAHTGSLAAGKLADFLLLSDDLLTVPPTRIPGIRVLLTVSGGRVVHEGR